MEDRIGSITAGKKADIVFIKIDDICLHPIHDPINTVVLFADRSSVDSVMIGGEFAKKDKILTMSADEISRKQVALADAVQEVFGLSGYSPKAG